MKIVFPVESLELGGGARYIFQLANALIDRNHDVEIVIPHNAPLVWPLRTKIRRVSKLTPSSIPKADFILPNFYTTVLPAWQSKKGKVVRLSLCYEPLWVKDAEYAKQTFLLDVPILSLSQWHRQIILQDTGRNSTIIGGGVDTEIFRPHTKLSAQTDRKTIFYILRSAGYTWKGSDDFWEACRRLLNSIPNLDICVVNPEGSHGETSVPYRTLAAPTDLEMARLYAQADLFVSTSYLEAFPLPHLEAMACGTAVVTTDSGGTREYTQQDGNCLIVPSSDIDQLTAAMHRLLINGEERQRLAVAGLNTAQNWSWQNVALKLENVLRVM